MVGDAAAARAAHCSKKKVLIGKFFFFFSGPEISFFLLNFRFSIESDSKNNFSRSRCIGSEPGIHENLAELELSTIRNELSVVVKDQHF